MRLRVHIIKLLKSLLKCSLSHLLISLGCFLFGELFSPWVDCGAAGRDTTLQLLGLQYNPELE